MRHSSTLAEDKLWQQLRRRNIGGLKFRRQHSIGRFVVDFYCAEAGLIIEVDGPIHDGLVEQDSTRQEFIESLGFRLQRFTNDQIENSLESVLKAIDESL